MYNEQQKKVVVSLMEKETEILNVSFDIKSIIIIINMHKLNNRYVCIKDFITQLNRNMYAQQRYGDRIGLNKFLSSIYENIQGMNVAVLLVQSIINIHNLVNVVENVFERKNNKLKYIIRREVQEISVHEPTYTHGLIKGMQYVFWHVVCPPQLLLMV